MLVFLQFPITAIREIKILKKLHHENVIKLKEIVTSQGNAMNTLSYLCCILYSPQTVLLTCFLQISYVVWLLCCVSVFRPWERWYRKARQVLYLCLCNAYQLVSLSVLQNVILFEVNSCWFLALLTDDNKYKGGIYMVFEYMDHDLTGLADRPGIRFTVPQIKVFY